MNLSSPSPPPNRPFLVALAAMTCVAFCNTLLNGFTFDDAFVYSENYWIQDLRNLPQLFTSEYFLYSNETSYRPVGTLTYFLDAAIWGAWEGGPHLTNLLLYIATVFLLFRFFLEVTRSQWCAVFGAGLFALHPIHTEVVNSLAYRGDLLIGLLLPAAWLLYKRSAGDKLWLWMPLACLLYLLAAFSKATAIVFPVLVVLLEVTETDRHIPSLLDRRRLLFLGSVVACTILFILVRFYWMRQEAEGIVPRLGDSIHHTLLAATKIHGWYLLLFFCPYQLRALYPASMYSPEWDATFFVSFSMLVVLLAFVIYFRRSRFFTLGVWWWFVCLIPASNLFPLSPPMAERYLFLPSIGLCLWIGWLTGSAYEAGRRAALLSGVAVLALVLAALCFVRNPVWRDNLRLWQATAETDPANPRVLAELAAAYAQAGSYDKATDQASRALQLLARGEESMNPAPIHASLAASYFLQGMLDDAQWHAQRAESRLPVRPDIDFSVYRTLGLVHDAREEIETALQHYRRAAEINPYRAELWRKISFCELRLGNRDRAKDLWERARELDRTTPRFEEIETLYNKSRTRPPL